MDKPINELLEDLLVQDKLDGSTYVTLLREFRKLTPAESTYKTGMKLTTLNIDKLTELAIRTAYAENPGIGDKGVSGLTGINIRTLYRYKAKMNLRV